MFKNNNLLKFFQSTHIFAIVISISTILININHAWAEVAAYNGPRYTKSIGYVKNLQTENNGESSKQIQPDQLKNPKTMPLVLNKKMSVMSINTGKNAAELNSEQYLSPLSHTFTIHQATTTLLQDDDNDGYFHYFSISFDADTTASVADVYARLYLSANGEPWYHFYTTDIFTLYFDSENDQYEVITALSIGYEPDYYDLRIELYDAFDDSMVAYYGPSNSIDLTLLPLEDETLDYVEYYNNDAYVHGGCTLRSGNSFDPVIPFLLIFSIFYLAKNKVRYNTALFHFVSLANKTRLLSKQSKKR